MSDDGLMAPAPTKRLPLSSVTLCAVSSTNLVATLEAMRLTMQYVDFADAILCTHDAGVADQTEGAIRVVPIERLTSAKAYSHFMLTRLVDYINTEHCLVIQWDGHVIDPARWRSEFLDYDYVGASWPQFDDGYEVGNGGFSLRSKRLMEACLRPEFTAHHPEDVAIGRTNRALLERLGLLFAPVAIADAFSAERSGNPAKSFGYHGAFHMPSVLGAKRFWDLYQMLDDRATLWVDFTAIVRGLFAGQERGRRVARLAWDRMIGRLSR
ncbi:DUF5672 family protein [Aurantiacibacter flavus]|uniref:DUF5672 family protein n=1 Tax=Aurantiacibacter flavus TaxID=3145232 RepID=A0ABV0CYZ7_9SPHN